MADYADVPYPGRPYARTHPSHLARLAAHHGLEAADPDDCSVVELGCGDALNIVAMAAASPGVRVAGMDLDEGAVARGRALAEALGLDVDLRVGDLRDPDTIAGWSADYVICHGLYSWVPAEVADAAMAAIAALGGVAFLSFNLLPGAFARRILSATLARHGSARAVLDELRPALADRDDPYGRLLAQQVARLDAVDEPMLVHDDLNPAVTAYWRDDVAAHATAHGLQVLCDALTGEAPSELMDLFTGAPYGELVLVDAAARPSRPTGQLAEPVPHPTPVAERPEAFALARLQARRGVELATLRHTRLILEDAHARALLVLCDGTRDHAALAAATGLDSDAVAAVLEELSACAVLLPPAAPRPRGA